LNGVVPSPPLLGSDEVAARLRDLPRWRLDGDTIRASYECASFADAISFVVRVAFLAEAADHHPDLDVRWRTVHLALTTHDSGGLTGADFDLAGRIDAVA
jgi:4a-hydroxytetrahydrobiopterin dehydratase